MIRENLDLQEGSIFIYEGNYGHLYPQVPTPIIFLSGILIILEYILPPLNRHQPTRCPIKSPPRISAQQDPEDGIMSYPSGPPTPMNHGTPSNQMLTTRGARNAKTPDFGEAESRKRRLSM
jgi:hypothetical protein